MCSKPSTRKTKLRRLQNEKQKNILHLSGSYDLSNYLTNCAILDIVFGSAATLLGASLTYALRRYKWLTPLPPILSNTLIVPWVLRFAYGLEDAIPYLMLTVGIGEVISCGVLGMMLLFSLNKAGKNILKLN